MGANFPVAITIIITSRTTTCRLRLQQLLQQAEHRSIAIRLICRKMVLFPHRRITIIITMPHLIITTILPELALDLLYRLRCPLKYTIFSLFWMQQRSDHAGISVLISMKRPRSFPSRTRHWMINSAMHQNPSLCLDSRRTL